MIRSVRFLVELSAIALALCLALPPQLIAAGRNAPDSAASPLPAGPSPSAPSGTTPDCGGENEKPCGVTTEFFWDNGNLFCDRALQATGFKVLPSPIYFNASDWLDLNRVNLTKLINLMRDDLPELEKSLKDLDEDDFLSTECIGTVQDGKCWTTPPVCIPVVGCSDGIPGLEVPLPNFNKSGWDAVDELIDFVDAAADALDSANLPAAIKGIPGAKPSINFDFSDDPDDFDLSSFKSTLDSVKDFLTDNSFIRKLKDLVGDFTNPPGRCVNRTRRQQAVADFSRTWPSWALVNQRNLARYEPVNWGQWVSTHNAFNNSADGYPLPNQLYSLTDQLNLGSRALWLDIHWFNNQVRLCHGTDTHGGCAHVDRYYANAVKEIGDWLRANPREVIFVFFEDYAAGRDEDVNDPLATYLHDAAGNNVVFTPNVAAERGLVPTKQDGQGNVVPDTDNMIWPSVQDILDAGKQIVLFGNDDHGGDWVWKQAIQDFKFRKSKNFYFTDAGWDSSGGKPGPYTGGEYLCVQYAGTDTFDLTRFEPHNTRNVFSSTYEARSLLDPFDFVGLLDEEKVARLARCQITDINLDFLHAKDQTSGAVCNADPLENNFDPATCATADHRIAAAVWSWREGDKGDRGDAAMLNGSDGRWSSRDPEEAHPFACANLREGKADAWADQLNQDWKITAVGGKWREGDGQCRAEFGEDYAFAVPVIGWQNEELKKKNGTRLDVWLNYNDLRAEGAWTINRRPKANAGPDLTSGEGQKPLNAGGSTDPDGDALSYAWSFGDGHKGAGAVPAHVYADNGTYTATLTVTDEFGGVNTDEVVVTVNNVAPSLKLGGNKSIKENGALTISGASFTDPGFDCPSCSPNSLENFTASIDWGEGTVTAGTVTETPGSPGKPSKGSVTGSYIYGDNGAYTVKVCVADDDGANACKTFRVTVGNVPPTVALDKSAAINTAGGQAFLGRRAVKPVFSADGKDVGTDDLVFLWSFPPTALSTSTRYFNNGSSNDPPQSPNGLFPFTVKHPNLTTFNTPGLYTARIRVTDDDGGSATDLLPLIVTDDLDCTRDWRQQFGRQGPQLIDLARLNVYLQIIRFASAYFDDTNLATPAQADAILRATPGGPHLEGARKELLEAWLNFASGGVGWGDGIKLVNQPFSQTVAGAESNLLKPGATAADYKRAWEAATRINQSTCRAR